MADPDPVGDLAVARAALELRARAEAERWAVAAADPEFIREMREVATDLRFAEAFGA